MEYYDLYLILFSLAGGALLFAITLLERHFKNRWFRLLFLLPGLGVWILGGLMGFDRDMLPVYIGGILMCLGMIYEKEKLRKGLSIFLVITALCSLLLCKVDPFYRCPDFVAEFEEGIAVLQDRYCMTQHKEIDFEDLHQRYLPRFQEAYRQHSKEMNYIAWHEMLCEFHDGHTYYMTEEEVVKSAENMMFGSDFGFSMITLSDGRTVAVNVEPGSEAEKAGIKLGTQILTLGNKSVEECKAEVKYFERVLPDIEVEEFYRALYAAGQSGDSLTVSFLDENGSSKETTLHSLGFYRERLLDTIDQVNGGRNIGTLTFEVIDNQTVLYRIKDMQYDALSSVNNDYRGLENEFRDGLLDYKNQGYTRLILDLRGNNGGSPFMIQTIAKILATEGEHFYLKYGIIDESNGKYIYDEESGKYVVDGEFTYYGEDLWQQGEIVILVNGYCISAGDHFTNMLYGQDNVKVIGFTKSNGSGQAVTACHLAHGAFSYSLVPSLDINGDIYIDPGVDRKAGVFVDEIVDFDEEALETVFGEKEDYLLQKACE